MTMRRRSQRSCRRSPRSPTRRRRRTSRHCRRVRVEEECRRRRRRLPLRRIDGHDDQTMTFEGCPWCQRHSGPPRHPTPPRPSAAAGPSASERQASSSSSCLPLPPGEPPSCSLEPSQPSAGQPHQGCRGRRRWQRRGHRRGRRRRRPVVRASGLRQSLASTRHRRRRPSSPGMSLVTAVAGDPGVGRCQRQVRWHRGGWRGQQPSTHGGPSADHRHTRGPCRLLRPVLGSRGNPCPSLQHEPQCPTQQDRPVLKEYQVPRGRERHRQCPDRRHSGGPRSRRVDHQHPPHPRPPLVSSSSFPHSHYY